MFEKPYGDIPMSTNLLMAKYTGKKSIVEYELKSEKTLPVKVAPDGKLSKH
jgi:hypothetical protein